MKKIYYCIIIFLIIFSNISCGNINKNSENSKDKINGEKNTTVETNDPISYNDDYDDENDIITREDAIDEYWDDIKEYVSGTETIEAFSYKSSNYYDLDADIEKGNIITIYFSNGGNLDFDAEIDNSGNASDTDENGNWWDFTIDMDSSIIDDAVEQWAEDNGFEIE